MWKTLHRPLHLPVVEAGAPCPVSAVGSARFAKYRVALGIGPGPAYPIGFSQPGSVLMFELPPSERSVFAGSEWSGQKVLWLVTPAYRGPLLIRGGRVDARDVLRFERGKVPPTELRITKSTARAGGAEEYGQRQRPSFTRVRAEGCYAYQIDGTTFSRTIVFQARRGN